MSYDTPNSTIRREASFLTIAGNAATSARMLAFQKMRLKKVHAMVVTAGSSAGSGHAVNIYNGTTSIGAIALNTLAAGVTASSSALNSTVESLGYVKVVNGTDATGVAVVTYEYEVLPDAAPSA